jgi:hypothetical protein
LGQSRGHISLVDTNDCGGGHGESITGSSRVRASPCGVGNSAEFADFNGADSTTLGVRGCFECFGVADVNFVIVGALYPSLLTVASKFRLYLHPLRVLGTRVSFITGLVVCC